MYGLIILFKYNFVILSVWHDLKVKQNIIKNHYIKSIINSKLKIIKLNLYQKINKMLNTISGGSVLPRQVIQWLDSLDLSYSVRNPKMDLSNGFTIAQILTRKYPNQVSILTFYNAQAKDKKYNNWEQLKKCKQPFHSLEKKLFSQNKFSPSNDISSYNQNFKISKQQIDSMINVEPQTAQSFLFRLYEQLTERKLNIDRRLTSTLPQPQQPLYKKPTASYVAKDRELQRIIDNKQKQFRTKTFISKHQNHIHTQKYNTGLIQWLIDKRKTQIHKQVERQRSELERKTKNMMNSQQKIQVKEIQLKCFNSSTSKKNKGQYGDFIDNKGVIQFLTESCSLLFKRQAISNDLKKLGIEIREKQISNLNIIQQLMNRCDEEDNKNNTKLSAETLNRILQQFKKTSELNLIMDNINSNFLDYKKFFLLFEKALVYYNKESETFKLIIGLITTIAKGLHQKYDSQNAEMMFHDIFLETLLKIGENENKRPVMSNLILDFVRKESQCYYEIIQKVKIYYSGNIRTFSSFLALFIEKISKDCDEIQYSLWSQFFYYGFLAIHNSSPSTRVNGAKIISRLFTDIIIVSNQIINQKLPILQKLIQDPWWQVRAQGIIIFKAILMSKFKNQSQSEENINEDLNTKTIEHYINQIFKPDVSHNILRIGLIELAELLHFQESFCQRYLQILLHVGVQIRTDVLTTSIIKFGPVVYGSNTFNYQLTGAPLVWNSLGIAKQLRNYIKKQGVQAFDVSHLEILYACVNKNATISKDSRQWLALFQQVKSMLFQTLMRQDLCGLALKIIQQFLSVQNIHDNILKVSRGQITRILNKIYSLSESKEQIQANILGLFRFLKQTQSEYTYKILKDFAERQKNKYLESNLIDFMNQLSRQRRKLIFNQ